MLVLLHILNLTPLLFVCFYCASVAFENRILNILKGIQLTSLPVSILSVILHFFFFFFCLLLANKLVIITDCTLLPLSDFTLNRSILFPSSVFMLDQPLPSSCYISRMALPLAFRSVFCIPLRSG